MRFLEIDINPTYSILAKFISYFSKFFQNFNMLKFFSILSFVTILIKYNASLECYFTFDLINNQNTYSKNLVQKIHGLDTPTLFLEPTQKQCNLHLNGHKSCFFYFRGFFSFLNEHKSYIFYFRGIFFIIFYFFSI